MATALHPYSGEHTPPQYGDYEAQRHWMEISLHLAPADWYVNTTQNNLSHWGLDYPPLSAYLSFLFGKLMHQIEPQSVALQSSIGYESPTSRLAMRATVVLADLCLFFPAVVLAVDQMYPALDSHRLTALAFVLTSPPLLLIDHAHFQYNNVAMALFLLTVIFLVRQHDALPAAIFSAAVYFKHLSLYYALPIACVLLSRLNTMLRRARFASAIALSTRVLLSIVIVTMATFAPWLHSATLLRAVLSRCFPLSRGLYEDKVANIWCSLSVIYRLQNHLPPNTAFRVCALVTLLASLPFCVAVARKPSPTRLLLSTSGCALSAFLFSYQVHEKQILLPLLPLALLYPRFPQLSAWFSFVATTSLFPLLWREGSHLAYFGVVTIHATFFITTHEPKTPDTTMLTRRLRHTLCTAAVATSVALHLIMMFAIPPASLPDLFVLANTTYACAHLLLLYAALLISIFQS